MKMTPAQNKRLHGLLNLLGLMEDKAALVYWFSAKRTESARELEPHQAAALIEQLAAEARARGLEGGAAPAGPAVPPPARQPEPTAPAPATKRRGRPSGTGRPATEKAPPSPEAADRMRRKLFAIGYAVGWLSGDTPEDRAMNRAKLNGILERISYLKKPLKDYAPAELPKLVSQFEQIERNYKKSATNREAGDAVAALLAELDLPTAPVATRSPRKPAAR